MVIGTTLTGAGVLTQLSQLSPTTNIPPLLLTVMWYVALAGFIIGAVGKGITAYFAADDVSTPKTPEPPTQK